MATQVRTSPRRWCDSPPLAAPNRTSPGKVLLVEAIYKVAAVANAAGGIGLFVDAKTEAAAAFYGRFGFEPTPTGPLTLFMPMDTLRRLRDA